MGEQMEETELRGGMEVVVGCESERWVDGLEIFGWCGRKNGGDMIFGYCFVELR